ncbi:hypothetical protein [Pseudomonas syringae group sp. J309-1]|uniref:tetratricopeptide repeat protein n=1 Tax=Pseudomonas syringae group sp. J309-1 TaxID=3079588 RepID=UPI00290F08A2|nr:hypothetical protein [Pseudomonas syringae group sp. J309-1]MDU8359277.1 hypothetical protein [Pseudomonas syringae group sp. J309-1]
MTEKKFHLSFELDFDKGLVLGANGADNAPADTRQKIELLMSNFLKDFSTQWVSKYDDLVVAGKYKEALALFSSMLHAIPRETSLNLIEILNKIDIEKLDDDGRQQHILCVIVSSEKLDLPEIALPYIDNLLAQKKASSDDDFRQALQLEQANCHAKLGKFSTATFLYRKLISSCENANLIAFANQGLSNISEEETDIILYAQRAADKHLEAGKRGEAAGNLIKISDIYSSKSAAKALDFIDQAIILFGTERLIDRELHAHLLEKKARYLFELERAPEALPVAEKTCELRRGLSGVETQLHGSLCLLVSIRRKINKHDEASDLKKEIQKLKEVIVDEEFHIRSKILENVKQKAPLSDEVIGSITGLNDPVAQAAAYIYTALNIDDGLQKCFELLDCAKQLAISVKDQKLLSLIYFSMGELYRRNDMIHEAIAHFKKSIDEHSYFLISVQACTALMLEHKLWSDAELFLTRRVELTGELPGVCLALAKALFAQKKYLMAYRYFRKSESDEELVKSAIVECLERMSNKEVEEMHHIISASSPKYISLEELRVALEEFAYSTSSKSRMHFWVKDKTSGAYKWTSRPEELSKQLLITFLSGKFGNDNIDIIQESRAGAGFVDLYIGLSGGLKVVIELKMCGGGSYSENYALSGTDQIVHYLDQLPTKIGFLVVFDGRTRDYGKNIVAIQTSANKTIYSIAVDLRNTVKS